MFHYKNANYITNRHTKPSLQQQRTSLNMNINDIFMNYTVYTITRGQGLFSCLIICVTDRLIWVDQSFHIVFRTGVFLLLAAVTCLRVVLWDVRETGITSLLLSVCFLSALSLFVWRSSGRCTGLYLSDSNQEEVEFMIETDCIHPLWTERIWSWDPRQWDKTFW